MEEQKLEDALAQTEKDADSAIKTATALLAQAKRIRKLAQVGSVRELAKAIDQAQQLSSATRDAIATTRTGWQFDARAHMESGGFAKEILELAAARGVAAEDQDGQIVCYPSLLRVLPSDEAIEIDKKRSRDIRPSRVVDRLQTAQSRPPKFKPEPFLEALYAAYKVLGGEQAKKPLMLRDIYKALTMLPGQSSAYSIPEFTRDIYLLDRSRVDQTKAGSRLSFQASTGAKGPKALHTVTSDGGVKTYYGIEFRS